MSDTPPAQGPDRPPGRAPGPMPPPAPMPQAPGPMPPAQAPGPMPPVQPPPAGWTPSPPVPLPAGVTLASYGQRVVAYLIDALIAVLLSIPGTILIVLSLVDVQDSGVNGVLLALGILLILAGVAVAIWNQGWRQGVTGQSWGKGFAHIKLVRAADGVPPGGGIGLGRWFLRSILGNVTSGIYTILTLLWPLWDERRQTLDDKIVSTLVVEERQPGR
jgi:uncharacterized RDD family membrane protein YckC